MKSSKSGRNSWIAGIVCAVMMLGLCGCGRGHDHAHDHDKDKKSHAGHAHAHTAKHGGVALVLGDEEYHIEFTYGETPGTLQAFFFDGEMENYMRIAAASFPALARIGEEERALVFHATANPATGETVGNTALFEAHAEWLAAKPVLTLSLASITVKSRTYTNLVVPLSSSTQIHAQNTP
jgi:hypothetical protein